MTFENSIIENALFDGCSMHGVNLKNANVTGSCFRSCDLGDANAEGTNFLRSVLELANMKGMKINDQTMWIRLHCPEKGAFLGYKKLLLYEELVEFLIFLIIASLSA